MRTRTPWSAAAALALLLAGCGADREQRITAPDRPSANVAFVHISGIGQVTVKGTYTFTASASNFTNPTYSWSERFCASGSCGAFTTLWVNATSTYTRVLTPEDCAPGATSTWQLRVVVSGGGLTAEDVHSVNLCRNVDP